MMKASVSYLQGEAAKEAMNGEERFPLLLLQMAPSIQGWEDLMEPENA